MTFRLGDALPQSKIDALQRCRELCELTHPQPRSEEDWEEYARTFFTSIEHWMDEGFGECVFRDPHVAKILADALLFFQDRRYFVSCYVVMPNHCHVVLCPLVDYAMEDILASWKGFVASAVNKQLSRRGPLWLEESYDRLVRDEEHLFRIVRYIGNNPKKANLPRDKWVRWVHPDWEAAGWGFRDEGP